MIDEYIHVCNDLAYSINKLSAENPLVEFDLGFDENQIKMIILPHSFYFVFCMCCKPLVWRHCERSDSCRRRNHRARQSR
jgi:hypothetical protein